MSIGTKFISPEKLHLNYRLNYYKVGMFTLNTRKLDQSGHLELDPENNTCACGVNYLLTNETYELPNHESHCCLLTVM